jgi:fused signal recognition particle receptor
MFGKLKDKLKKSLSVFSKKAEEAVKSDEDTFAATETKSLPEAEEKEVEQLVEEPIQEEERIEEPIQKEVIEGKKKEPIVVDEQELIEEKEEITIKENPKEVKLKEEHLSKKELEEDLSEDKLEQLDEQIKEDQEDKEEVPQKFDAGKQKFEPDMDKIEEIKEKPRTTEDLIKETKEKFADDHLTFKEKKEKKKAEKGPSAAELLEEVKVEEKVKEKKLFGLFKKKEKVIEEKEEEPTPEPKVEEKEELATETTKEEPKEEEKKGFFGKVKQTLTTKTISADKFENLFWELELALLENNVSVEVIEKIKLDLKEELVDKPLPRDVLKKIEDTLARTMKEILTFDQIDIVEKSNNKKPLVIAFFGINGCGKTTSIAKLANYLKENGKSVVLAACDTFRAAAIQQLEEHANKLEVKMIKHDYGSDAAAVAFDAVKHAEKNEIDVVLIDTAGRLHSNVNLMAELEKIIRVTTPDLKIFVGESITGNDCIEQAKKFNELVEMDGAILTKADIDEKGGAPLSIAYTIKKPILFLGMGQEYKDFEVFNPKVILDRLGF